MIERLFTETFFKKNDYFKNKINISNNELNSIKNSIENWKKNCENFNPDLDKETTDENEFINTVFKDILRYVGKGTNSQNYHIYPKFKIESAGVSGGTGYADLALGYFTRQKGKENEAQVLIEFKDMNSDDLDKPSTRKDKLSPVNQCWNYLEFYGKAKWGIVTNFNEIRIYYKNKGKRFYEVFYFIVPEEYQDKFKPLTEDTEIYKFITILKFNHFLSDPNVNQQDSFTEEILASQTAAEEKVKKEFYLEFKTLRSEVFYNLLEINPSYNSNKSRLLELVQKLLDRIIFCWFCEDSRAGLLPINVLSKEIIGVEIQGKYYSDQDDDIYSKVRKLFKAIDVGGNFNITEGYNGELFKEDIELDSLKIPNFLFKKISEIGLKYDFGDENELNVNILGHIFEQSISDLEEMRVQFQEYSQETSPPSPLQNGEGSSLFGEGLEVIEHKHQKFDPKKTKRKKEGVYYTPDYITKYIVENTVGEWLKEKWQATNLKFSNIKKNKEYITLQHYRDEYLSKIKILDPACGSGAFLVAAFDYLWNEHERIYKQIKEIKTKTAQGELFDFDLINKTILENNLYGVDLNRESVEITKLSLWLKTAVKNKKLNNLENNIKVGNSLIDDPNVAGDLAFNWVKEFPDIFPPQSPRDSRGEDCDSNQGGGFDVVIGNPPYVRADVDNQNYQRQRKWMENSGKYKTLYEKWDLYIAFLERGLYLLDKGGTLSFIISNSYNTVKYAEKSRNFIFKNYELHQIDFFENVQVFEGIGVESVILKIRNQKDKQTNSPIRILHKNQFDETIELPHKKTIEEIFRISSSMEFENKFENTELLGNICFISVGMVLNADEFKAKGEFKKEDLISEVKDKIHSKEYVEADYISRYFFENIKYLEWDTERVPSKVRRPTFIELYSKPKIFKGFTSDAVYDDKGFVSNHGLMILLNFHYLREVENLSINNSIKKWNKKERFELEKISKNYDLKYILAILNSKFAKFYLNTIRRHRIEYYFYPDDLKNLPIKNIDKKIQKPFIKKVDTMLVKNKELQDATTKFNKLLKSDFQVEKIPKKLEDWYRLSWDEFLKELKKKKIQLSLKQKSEWMDYFESEKQKALSTKEIIDKTDKEIDKMVYELYGLTEEEIKIVEGEII